eukprot:5215024-Amphidinium_carterae.1
MGTIKVQHSNIFLAGNYRPIHILAVEHSDDSPTDTFGGQGGPSSRALLHSNFGKQGMRQPKVKNECQTLQEGPIQIKRGLHDLKAVHEDKVTGDL